MPSIMQPLNSVVKISPYSQRLLHYGIEDSKIYLSKATNSLLTAFTYGYDRNFFKDSISFTSPIKYSDRDSCILDGLNTHYSLNGNILEVVVDEGSLIVDSTLLVFPEPTTLDLNLGIYGDEEDSGIVVVSVQFQWIDSLYEMPPKLRLVYINPYDDFDVSPDGWWFSQDKLVISTFNFNRDEDKNIIPESIVHNHPIPSHSLKIDHITIKGQPYEIGPLPKFWYNLLDSILHSFTRKEKYIIPGALDPTGLPESIVTMPVYLSNVEDIDLISVNFTIGFDETLVENPRIERGQASIDSGKNTTLIPGANYALVDISGPNTMVIGDGVLCYITFDIKREVPRYEDIEFQYGTFDATDITSSAVSLNGSGEPQVYTDTTSFIADRPSNEGVYDWDKCWKFGEAPYHHVGTDQFFANIKTDLGTKDCIIQCYINDLKIQPSAIQHVDDETIRIWMNKGFIFNSETIPNMKVLIVG